MDDDTEKSSDGELMFTGPTSSDYLVVVDSKFPRQIQNHPLHPSHPLFLVQRKSNGGNTCNSCRVKCSKGIFIYRCNLCDFDLDTNCAILPTIKYLGHPDHLLSLCHINVDYKYFDHPCKACKTQCDGHVLCCVPCNFYLHLHCLPHKVKHNNHRHFFTLTTSIMEEDRGINELVCFECDAKINPDEPVYYCAKCCYPFHIGCSSEAIAEHPESGQVLVGVDKEMVRLDAELKTTAPYDLEEEFTALKARILFLEQKTPHKETSTKFPLKIKHPFHSQHPLTLTVGQDDSFLYKDPVHSLLPVGRVNPFYYKCSVCWGHNYGFRYHCSKCNFFLDLNCVLRKPTIKYDGHQEHLLVFLKKIYRNPNGCEKCKQIQHKSSSRRFKHKSSSPRCVDCIFNFYGNHESCKACKQSCDNSSILRCADCNFNLHTDCFPSLPSTFKNPRCHLHTLTLTNSFSGDLSTDEFYCDFCEDERDPKLPVYYCEECPFVAHVTCVLYEELPSILAELDSTKRDGGVEESVFVDVSNDKIGDEDPTLAKFDVEMRELEAKLEELKEKRTQYLASDS